jgi:hypothetical protein
MRATADSRKGWGQLVPKSFQSGFILSGGAPPLFVRILESAMHAGSFSRHAWELVIDIGTAGAR